MSNVPPPSFRLFPILYIPPPPNIPRLERKPWSMSKRLREQQMSMPPAHVHMLLCVRHSSVDVSKAGKTAQAVADACEAKGANVRIIDSNTVGLSFGEAITQEDVVALVRSSPGSVVQSFDCICSRCI